MVIINIQIIGENEKILYNIVGELYMKIKNKFSKQKIDKSNIRLNKRLKLKGKLRLFTKNIKSLTKMEEFLFTENHTDFNDKLPIKEEKKYLRISDLYLINFVTKTNCSKLFDGILSLCDENPLQGYLGGEIRPKEIKDCIMSFAKASNDQRWTRLCNISPKNKELLKYCNYMTISLFEVSNDLMGINFQLCMTDDFNKDLETILMDNIKSEKTYSEYKYKTKKLYSISYPRLDDIRNSNFEDLLLEVKCQFNNLLLKYLPLELKYKLNPPISLNIYQTNYMIEEKDDFLNSLNLIKSYNAQKKEDFSVCIREKEKGDTFIHTKMWYDISIEHEKIDRSNNMFIFIDDKKIKIINDVHEFTNFLLSTITFYQLEEMIIEISKERNKLYNCPYKKIKKNYNQYEQLNKKMQKYRMIFNGIRYHKIHYKDEYLEKGFDFLNKKYKDYYSQYEELSREYTFRMNINNSKSSFTFAKVSIVVAIIALLLTIYFEYRKENNKCVNIDYNIVDEKKCNQ